MKIKELSTDQCIRIDNIDQFNKIRHLLRNPAMEYNGKFPIYLEIAESISRGSSIGIIIEPVNTWTQENYQIIDFEHAFEKQNNG